MDRWVRGSGALHGAGNHAPGAATGAPSWRRVLGGSCGHTPVALHGAGKPGTGEHWFARWWEPVLDGSRIRTPAVMWDHSNVGPCGHADAWSALSHMRVDVEIRVGATVRSLVPGFVRTRVRVYVRSRESWFG